MKSIKNFVFEGLFDDDTISKMHDNINNFVIFEVIPHDVILIDPTIMEHVGALFVNDTFVDLNVSKDEARKNPLYQLRPNKKYKLKAAISCPSVFSEIYLGEEIKTFTRKIDFSSFNGSNCTDLCGAFEGWFRLEEINFDKAFSKANITDASSMFENDYSLKTLDLSSVNFSECTDTSRMFCSCSALTDLKLGYSFTNKLETTYLMFDGCGKLSDFGFLYNLDWQNIYDASYMIRKTGIREIDFGQLKNFGATGINISGFLIDCPQLFSLKFDQHFLDNIKWQKSTKTNFSITQPSDHFIDNVRYKQKIMKIDVPDQDFIEYLKNL
jgi:hypothetical protein